MSAFNFLDQLTDKPKSPFLKNAFKGAFSEKPQPRPQPAQHQEQAPQQERAQASHYEPQPNMFQEHSAMQADMYGRTQQAWNGELQSRVEQAREARQQQHERELEAMRQQGAMARMEPQESFAPTRRSMMAPPMGGHSIAVDGYGNMTVNGTPIRTALLG